MLVNVGLIRGSRKSGLLVQPGFLSGFVTYTRTGIATGETTAGIVYEVAANFPRFNSDNELIWEGSRTNNVPNPRVEGYTPGAVGTGLPPTSWASLSGSGSRAYTNPGTVLGLTGCGFQISGAGNWLLSATGPRASAPSASSAQQRSYRVSYRLVSGSAANLSELSFLTVACNAAGTAVAGSPTPASTNVAATITSSWQDILVPYTLQTDPNIARVSLEVSIVTTGTAEVALVLVQEEAATFSSTPILPPLGAAVVSTRGPDTGVFNTTPTGALVFAMRPGQAAPASTNQVYVTVNAGSDANRWEFGCQPAGNNLLLTRVVGGTGNNTASVGTQVPGSMVIGVLTWDSAGNGAVKIQGGTYRSFSAGPTDIIRGRLGNRISGVAALFGKIAYIKSVPNMYLTEAEMDAEIAAVPPLA